MLAPLPRGLARDERAALNKLRQARRLVLHRFVFYGHAAYHLELRLSRRFPLMATDGRYIDANPDWILETPLEIVAGVLAHEIGHVLNQHHLRRGTRDFDEWNVACDYAINGPLRANGVRLAPGMLHDAQYDNLSAEAIYARRANANAEQAPPPPPPPPADDASADSETDDNRPDPGDNADDDPAADDAADGDPSSSSDGGPDPSAGHDEQSGSTPGDGSSTEDGSPNAPSSSGSGGPDADGSPEPDAQDSTRSSASTSAASTAPSPSTPADQSGKSYGNGGCVLDAGTLEDQPLSPAQLQEEKGRWSIIARQSAALARSHGQGTAGYVEIDAMIGSTATPWQDLLAAFMLRRRASDYSWSPPNRRFVDDGLYLPSMMDDRLDTVVLAVDTSGSTLHARDRFATEFSAILDRTRPRRIVIVYCHDQVSHAVDATENDLPLTLERCTATGGTAFAPVFAWLEEQQIDPDCVVYLTDLIASQSRFGAEPRYPVLWASVGDRAAPWGDIVMITD